METLKKIELVDKVISLSNEYGFLITIKSEYVVSVSKNFTPNNMDEFTQCDMFGPSILDLIPLKNGSVWGTDGGSIGGMVALKNGHYVLNKSGDGAKQFLKQLKKRLG